MARIVPALLLLAFTSFAGDALVKVEQRFVPDDQWTRFRGPDGNGVSLSGNPPIKWSGSDLRWKLALSGEGHSSPVIWKGRAYLTSGNPQTGERYVICVQIADGSKVWETNYPSQTFTQHSENSFGTSTPTVNESGVFVYWTTPAAIQVTALSLDGQAKWVRGLGPFKGKHGSGASPVIYNQLVWINNDQDGPSALLALDAKTGEIKYKIERQADKVSYSTPCVLRRDGRPEELIFAASSHGLTSINPRDGTVNWDCTNLFSSRVVSSPITSDGLVICSSGEGGVGRRLVAVRPPTDKTPAAVVYEFKNNIPNIPTPLAKDGRLYILSENGLLRCVRAATGESIWQEKLPERFYGSPVWAADRLYFTSKSGTVFVIAAGDNYELLAQNALGEPSFATPAVVQDTLLFRTVSHLIAVGGKK